MSETLSTRSFSGDAQIRLLKVVGRAIRGDELREGLSFKKSQRWSVIAVTSSRGQRSTARFSWSRWLFEAAREMLGAVTNAISTVGAVIAVERMVLLSTRRRKLESSIGNLGTPSRNDGKDRRNCGEGKLNSLK